MSEQLLELFVYTYNRSRFLDATLKQLAASPFSSYQITVLDNCSTDDTPNVCEKYSSTFTKYRVIKHRKNIGACGNYLRAVEMAAAKYAWMICDDDNFDFSRCQDVLEQLELGQADLISLGTEGHGLILGTDCSIEECASKQDYFLWHTSIPSFIYKTELFDSANIIAAYDYSDSMLPHFPFIVSLAEKNAHIYISKHVIIKKSENLGYSPLRFLRGWLMNCNRIENPRWRKKAFGEVFGFRKFYEMVTYSVLVESVHRRERLMKEFAQLVAEARKHNPMLLLKLMTMYPLVIFQRIWPRPAWHLYELYRQQHKRANLCYDAER